MVSIPEENKYRLHTSDGPICGFIDQIDEDKYYRFNSIPYAKPPLGQRRFKPPSPVDQWKEELDCTRETPSSLCFNCDHGIIGSEDCLYLEVITKTLKPTKPLPVMFWLGGVGFEYYTDKMYDPKLILDQDILFVKCSYRLGPLGFLSINDFSAPGNCGLKDITLALKWIQKNIRFFGGDNNNVTIFGNSSGGALAHFLILSPMTYGLFHKAIIQSATALNGWSIDRKPTQIVSELARELGLTETYPIEILDKLRTIPSEVLVKTAMDMISKKYYDHNTKRDTFDCYFKPCIEQEFEGQASFITKNPSAIIKSGNYNKVPMIIGSTNIEGALFQFMKHNFYEDYQKFNDNVSLLAPWVPKGEESELPKKMGQQLLKFYLDGEDTFTEETKPQYIQLISDYYFLYYVNKTVRLHSQYSPEIPIYYYVINYAGEWTVPKELTFFNTLSHCSELPYLFRIKLTKDSPACKGSRESIKTRDRLTRMWTNFAKYGNPTPHEDDPLLQITWDPVEASEKLNYLSIGSELTKGRNPFQDRMLFWDQLHKQYAFLRVLTHLNELGLQF